MKKIKCFAIVIIFTMVLGLIPQSILEVGGTVEVAANAPLTLAQLREKFPNGKYWNHVGNPGAENYKNNQDGYTSTPCGYHGDIGTKTQTCNAFMPNNTQLSWQCMGYAEKLGYDSTGYNPRNNANGWYTYTNVSALDNLKAGDIVRYKNNGHSIFVTGVNGETVTYTDCNSDGHCKIRWDCTISKLTLRSSFTHVRSSPGIAIGNNNSIDTRYPTPFYAYNLANANTPAYSGVNGTKVGNIYGSDKCTIQEVYTNGWCKVNCPWTGYSNGRIVYVQLTTFIASGYTPSTIKAPKRTDVYKRSNGADYMGYIDPDDTVVKVGTSGSYTQTIFPLNTGGYMCAWTPTSNLEVQKYTISYNANGGIGAPGNQTKTQDQTLTLTTSKPNKNYTITYNANGGSVENGSKTVSCTFRNWNTNANGSGSSYNAGGSYTANAGATLYAQWNNPTAGNLETPTRSGYTFAGWYTAASGGSQVTSGTTITGNTTLYAHWNINKYSISYNANGGSGAPDSQTKEYNATLTLSNTKPTRDGYTFLGWSTSSTATSATYQSGGSYTVNSNVTLYAVWQKNSSAISGNVTSYDIGKSDVVTIRLLNTAGISEIKKVQCEAGASAQVAYEIKDVQAGNYILEVSKEGHVTRTYEVTVGQSSVTQNMKICPKGDVTGDGKVTTMDVTRTNMHARGLNQLSGYELACADVVGTDGKVTTMDVTRINAHVRGISALW